MSCTIHQLLLPIFSLSLLLYHPHSLSFPPLSSSFSPALNATVKVQRLWSRQPQPQPEPGEHFTLVTQVLNPDPPLTRSGMTHSASQQQSIHQVLLFKVD